MNSHHFSKQTEAEAEAESVRTLEGYCNKSCGHNRQNSEMQREGWGERGRMMVFNMDLQMRSCCSISVGGSASA